MYTFKIHPNLLYTDMTKNKNKNITIIIGIYIKKKIVTSITY